MSFRSLLFSASQTSSPVCTSLSAQTDIFILDLERSFLCSTFSVLEHSLTFASTPASAKRWAVLVSGSSGYYNYRHVADTCHAYNLLIKAGVHPDRIIHLAVDDAARHIANPFPGQLFNRPTAGEDDDDRGVYEGCRIDYRGEKVTTNTLLAVLRGDSAAVEGGKVLRSTERDNVFIFYSGETSAEERS